MAVRADDAAGNDRLTARFALRELGHYLYTVRRGSIISRLGSATSRRSAAGQDTRLDEARGAELERVGVDPAEARSLHGRGRAARTPTRPGRAEAGIEPAAPEGRPIDRTRSGDARRGCSTSRVADASPRRRPSDKVLPYHRAPWSSRPAPVPAGSVGDRPGRQPRSSAKSRLGAVLDAEERRDLALRLARRTIRAAVATPGIAETLVVTPDDEVRATSPSELGARPMRQRSRRPQPTACAQARDEAIAAGADGVLILPIDLPAVSSRARSTTSSRALAGPAPAARRDRRRTGTAAARTRCSSRRPTSIDVLLRRRQPRWPTSAAAAAAGARLVELDGPLSLDIDTPDDLLLAEAAIGCRATVR